MLDYEIKTNIYMSHNNTMPSSIINLLTMLAYHPTHSKNKIVPKHSFPPREQPQRIFKQYKRRRVNPGRANRHKFTNKDMRSW